MLDHGHGERGNDRRNRDGDEVLLQRQGHRHQGADHEVAAGMGICVVPEGVSRLRPDEVVYRALSDPQAVSPIIMSTRLHDQNEDIVTLRGLIDHIYQEQAEARQRSEAARAAASDPSTQRPHDDVGGGTGDDAALAPGRGANAGNGVTSAARRL